MPATTRAMIGVGVAVAGPTTAAHNSSCSLAVRLLMSPVSEFVEDRVVLDSQVEIGLEQRPKLGRVGCRQQVGPDILRADRVGLGLLQVLALVVASRRHREAESDDQAEQRQGGSLQDAEVLAHVVVERIPPAEPDAEPRRQPQDRSGDQKRTVG